ncbi:putative ADP-ribosylglycohydrolase [Corallococcus coralloides]|uniref:Putative ADP-ribosylglycohydrolase n=1 Tax=Corallococcus coralloides TaxID=184914 RepID=A0A410RWT9_CORCK|nr:ADP-ribosylglycohydrolase family protein [Corallococcus coralloides]QAT86311.1 putative ADP-ribosylglycohydrolase [Corallococcus coralloides]
MLNREERIAGGLYGLLIGDALGVPYEFHRPETIPSPEAIEYTPPPGFDRAHDRVPPGTWSDDGAHALCLLDSLTYQKRLDCEDLGRRLVNWQDWGYLAVDGEVVKSAIRLGHDTDTTACVAGGIAGLIHGLNGIPHRWRSQLRGQELVEPLVARLMKSLG